MENTNAQRPEVSILLPFRNEEKYIRACVESIVNQSFSRWELLAINDHSNDKGPEIMKTLTCTDPRIRLLKNEGVGIIDALWTAYKYSRGTFISRMDADDIMVEDKIEQLYNTCLSAGKGNVAVGLVEYFSQNELGGGYMSYAEWLNEHTRNGSNLTELYLECPIPSPCWMMHREDLDLCKAFQPNIYPEDYDLVFRMHQHGVKVAGINKVLHRWRDHDERSSRNSPHYKDNRFTKLKVHHFIQQDHIPKSQLIVWGTGKKGKSVASELQLHNIDFRWITNNPKKIETTIWQVAIQSYTLLETLPPSQIIIAFSTFHNPESYHDIVSHYPQHQFFRFF